MFTLNQINNDFTTNVASLTLGKFGFSDYILLLLLITMIIFLAITKIGKLYKTKLYLVAMISILGYLSVKELATGYYDNADENFLIMIGKFLGLLFLVYLLIMQEEEKREHLRFEYPTIILLALFGILLTIENTESLIIFLGLEIQAFSYYTMVAMKEKDISSAEGALKYFLIGAMASGLFIFGVGLLYGKLGTTNFLLMADLFVSEDYILILGGLLIIISLLFKIGAAPFHLWLPDAYAGAPFYVLLFLLTIPKIGLFYLLFTLNNIFEQNLIILLALLLSAIIGSIQAFAQTKIKKFIAYTVIYNNTFFLSILLLSGKSAYYGLLESVMLYLLVSLTTALGFFALRHVGTKLQLTSLRDLVAIKKTNGIFTLVLVLGFFSAAGIPPFIGFFQKYLILWVLAEKFQIFLMVILILSAILPAYYYIRIPKITYFLAQSEYAIVMNITKGISTLLSICAALFLVIFY